MRARHAVSLACLAGLPPVSACLAQAPEGWVAVGDPSPRTGHAMTYDTQRGVAVLFGGVLGGGTTPYTLATSDTWEYDGEQWRFRALEGPTPRINAAIAYDGDRHVTVLFGGKALAANGSFTRTGDTWEWDGTAWFLRTTSGPPARDLGGMVYDQSRHVTLLVGGQSTDNIYSTMNDAWTWDGQAWTQAGNGPGYQADLSMVFDPSRGRVVALTRSGMTTMTWDGQNWPSLGTAIGTAARLAFDPVRAEVVAVERTNTGHTWLLTPDGWIQTGDAPIPAQTATIVYHDHAGRLMTFGQQVSGHGDGIVAGFDLLETGWVARTNVPQPAGAESPALAFDSGRGVSVLFGGMRLGAGGGASNETWELRGDTWRRRTSGPMPGSEGCGMCYDPRLGLCVLAGGTGLGGQTWLWDGVRWSQAAPFGHGSMYDSMAYDAHLGAPVMVSGSYVATFDGRAWTALPTGGFSYSSVAFDPVRNTTVDGGSSSGGTYALVGQQFVLLPAGQCGAWAPGMAFDPVRGGLMLFGGFTGPLPGGYVGSFPNVTYFLGSQASAWTILPNRSPSGRKFLPMVYDSLSNRLVMVGGSDHSSGFRETWVWSRGPTSIAVQPRATTGYMGRTVELYLVARGGGTLGYQWRRDGAALQNGERTAGARRDTLLIREAEAGDAGSYECIVSGPGGVVTSDSIALTMTCYANCDGSSAAPVLSVSDFSCFLQRFASGDDYANCDASTQAPALNVADFACFLRQYALGCP